MQESCGITDIGCWLEWLAYELKQLIRDAYDGFMQGLASLLSMIPVPDFMAEPAAFTLPDSVIFWLGLFQVGTGCSMVVGAYLLRFILRRIPFIG